MNFRYDKEANALSIRLSEGAISSTEEIDAGTLVDLDRLGHVMAIEIINPARAWPLGELAERYQIADEDLRVLRSLWDTDRAFPFSEPELVA